jgi:ribosomal protein S18 acetylase RimI-like enzyme
VDLRRGIREEDVGAVAAIVAATGLFSPAEFEIALEVARAGLAGEASGYHFAFADSDFRSVGYCCYGAIPGTRASFDLYWIAVHPDWQGRGVGRMLLAEAERRVAALGGRRLYVETSGRPDYARTRAFYERAGYRCEARLEDFYTPGDAKVIYVKALGPEPRAPAPGP